MSLSSPPGGGIVPPRLNLLGHVCCMAMMILVLGAVGGLVWLVIWIGE